MGQSAQRLKPACSPCGIDLPLGLQLIQCLRPIQGSHLNDRVVYQWRRIRCLVKCRAALSTKEKLKLHPTFVFVHVTLRRSRRDGEGFVGNEDGYGIRASAGLVAGGAMAEDLVWHEFWPILPLCPLSNWNGVGGFRNIAPKALHFDHQSTILVTSKGLTM